MAAEPVTLKTTLAIAAAAVMGPLIGEYSLILLGGFLGALLALQRTTPRLPGWQALVFVLTSMIAGTLFCGVASAGLVSILPSWASVDLLWMPVAGAIAMYWQVLADMVPKLLQRWIGKEPT